MIFRRCSCLPIFQNLLSHTKQLQQCATGFRSCGYSSISPSIDNTSYQCTICVFLKSCRKCRNASRFYSTYKTPHNNSRSSLIRLMKRHGEILQVHQYLTPGFCQQANFMSFPGTGAKHKDYAERRLVGFSMEQMYEVVSDVEKYQEFLPWCQKSLVKSRRKGHVVADLVIGFPPLLESYTSSVTLVKPHLIRAESTEGKLFSKLITAWKFSPGLKGKPQTCVVDFVVSFEFKSALTSQLANAFFNEVVRAMAGAFFNEAKRRFGTETVPSRKINIVSSDDSGSGKS